MCKQRTDTSYPLRIQQSTNPANQLETNDGFSGSSNQWMIIHVLWYKNFVSYTVHIKKHEEFMPNL